MMDDGGARNIYIYRKRESDRTGNVIAERGECEWSKNGEDGVSTVVRSWLDRGYTSTSSPSCRTTTFDLATARPAPSIPPPLLPIYASISLPTAMYFLFNSVYARYVISLASFGIHFQSKRYNVISRDLESKEVRGIEAGGKKEAG